MNTVSFTVPANSPAIPKILALIGDTAGEITETIEAPAPRQKKGKAAADPAAGPGFEDCKKLMKEALDIEGVAFEGVRKILQKFKVAKLNDMDPAKFGQFHAALAEAIEAAKLSE